MDQHTLLLAAVPVTGFIAGFINTLAGSGSLLTLPIPILLGLPANVANGTNRVLLAVMLAKPERWIAAHAAPREPRLLVEVPVFFAIGVYGGFIQVSVGLFLLAGLVLGAGYNLLGANALKNLIVLVFTAAALVVFVVNDQVQWTLGLLLGAGQAVGAWVAAHFAVARGAEFVRWAVVVITVVAALALFAGVGS